MLRRIIFDSSENRESFFVNVLKSFNIRKWKELRNLLKISRSMLDSYKSGKITLPEEIYNNLTKNFSSVDKKIFINHIQFLDFNWGRIKGGRATYFKHKYLFDVGRKNAIRSIVRKAEERFDINMELDNELAYFMGLFIGDGFTNKYGRYYLIQFTGDMREKQFYQSLVSDYCKKLFNIIPRIKNDKHSNAIRVNLYSVALFRMITQRFKISAGRKSHTVLIPKEILNSDSKIISSCVRGLYDAEGCVFFDKRKQYKKPYPRIELHMCNLDLLKQVSNILADCGIKNVVGESDKNLRVTVRGQDNVDKFIKKVGFSNPKQLDKLRFAGLI